MNSCVRTETPPDLGRRFLLRHGDVATEKMELTTEDTKDTEEVQGKPGLETQLEKRPLEPD